MYDHDLDYLINKAEELAEFLRNLRDRLDRETPGRGAQAQRQATNAIMLLHALETLKSDLTATGN